MFALPNIPQMMVRIDQRHCWGKSFQAPWIVLRLVCIGMPTDVYKDANLYTKAS